MKRVCLALLLVPLLLAGCSQLGFTLGVVLTDDYPPPSRIHHPTRMAVITERVWNPPYGYIFVHRTVVLYWNEGYGCYGWYDSYGRFHIYR